VAVTMRNCLATFRAVLDSDVETAVFDFAVLLGGRSKVVSS